LGDARAGPWDLPHRPITGSCKPGSNIVPAPPYLPHAHHPRALCARCGYDLAGVPGAAHDRTTCPECGLTQEPTTRAPARPTRSALIGLLIGAALTISAIILALSSIGDGHGDFVFARLLFPYSMLLTLLTRDITAPLITLEHNWSGRACAAGLGQGQTPVRTLLCAHRGIKTARAAPSLPDFLIPFPTSTYVQSAPNRGRVCAAQTRPQIPW
jgi:hypothetical protein